MLLGDASKYKPVLGLLVLMAVAAAGVTWGLWGQAKIENEAAQNEARYIGETYSIAANKCLPLMYLARAECIANAANAARDFQRAERDLVAQRVTSLWTALMGTAAIVGVLLSMVGAYLVWTTFRETREANRLLRLGNRPWIEVSNIRVLHSQIMPDCNIEGGAVGDAFVCTVVYDLVNIGGSPARVMFAYGEVYNPDTDRGKVRRAKLERMRDHVTPAREGFFLAPGGRSSRWLFAMEAPDEKGRIPLFFKIVAVYTSSDRAMKMETSITGFIGERQPEILGMPNDNPVQLSLEGIRSGKQNRIDAMQVHTVTMT